MAWLDVRAARRAAERCRDATVTARLETLAMLASVRARTTERRLWEHGLVPPPQPVATAAQRLMLVALAGLPARTVVRWLLWRQRSDERLQRRPLR